MFLVCALCALCKISNTVGIYAMAPPLARYYAWMLYPTNSLVSVYWVKESG